MNMTEGVALSPVAREVWARPQYGGSPRPVPGWWG